MGEEVGWTSPFRPQTIKKKRPRGDGIRRGIKSRQTLFSYLDNLGGILLSLFPPSRGGFNQIDRINVRLSFHPAGGEGTHQKPEKIRV